MTFREAVEEVAIVVAKVQQPSLFVLIDWLVVVVFTQVPFLESSKCNLSHIHILILEFFSLFLNVKARISSIVPHPRIRRHCG